MTLSTETRRRVMALAKQYPDDRVRIIQTVYALFPEMSLKDARDFITEKPQDMETPLRAALKRLDNDL